MKNSLLVSLGLLALVLILTGCGGSSENDYLPFLPAGPKAAPDPMLAGPFPVGVVTYEFVDESRIDSETGQPRSFLVEAWYPAVQESRDLTKWTYEVDWEASPDYLGDDYYQRLVNAGLPGMETKAVRDADIDNLHGPYPLVLFSHGSYGIRWQSVFYTLHLASHGYVVVSADHTGNTVWELIRDGFDD
ncbi:MAG: hypothetical protein JRJ87_26475, partial [Deltaproteobacteria bacterium]|nr:hypothetical protein [Deltaproteobacteria bacterium]